MEGAREGREGWGKRWGRGEGKEQEEEGGRKEKRRKKK